LVRNPKKTKTEERAMKNFTNSDYALNKHSKGIVYRFADGIVEITLADYLAESPDKTEADFLALKEFSDSDYFTTDRAEYAQTKKNLYFNDLDETMLCSAPSPEKMLISEITAKEETERQEQRVELKNLALGKLTGTQRRRYLLYHVDGKTEEEIADMEGATQQAVSQSLLWSDRKIKKVLAAAKK